MMAFPYVMCLILTVIVPKILQSVDQIENARRPAPDLLDKLSIDAVGFSHQIWYEYPLCIYILDKLKSVLRFIYHALLLLKKN